MNVYGPLAWALGTHGPTFGYGPLAWALGTLGPKRNILYFKETGMTFYMNQYDLGVSFLFWVLVSFSGCYPRDGGLYKASYGPHGPQAPGPLKRSDDEHLKWARPLTNCAQEKINA